MAFSERSVPPSVPGQCVEKRAFYRLISGLHASINIHLSARYLLDGETPTHAGKRLGVFFTSPPALVLVVFSDNWFQKKWGHNVPEFRKRFDAELTAGEGPKRLRNLYFLYLIELRALAKALPFFQRSSFQLYTGRAEEDQKHKEMMLDILQLARSGFVPVRTRLSRSLTGLCFLLPGPSRCTLTRPLCLQEMRRKQPS